MEAVDENPVRSWILLGCHLSERIGVIVVPPGDVMQLDSLEFALQFAHLLAIGVHEGAFVVGLLHDLVYHQLGVTISE
jgi:hypothetical protein